MVSAVSNFGNNFVRFATGAFSVVTAFAVQHVALAALALVGAALLIALACYGVHVIRAHKKNQHPHPTPTPGTLPGAPEFASGKTEKTVVGSPPKDPAAATPVTPVDAKGKGPDSPAAEPVAAKGVEASAPAAPAEAKVPVVPALSDETSHK